MHYTPDSKAIEALGDRIAEQIKGITHRLGTASGAAERTLAWLEQEVMRALKGVGQSLLAGLCELQVTRYPVAEFGCACGGGHVSTNGSGSVKPRACSVRWP